jgi:hypothetical protein
MRIKGEYSPKRRMRTGMKNTLNGGAMNGKVSSAQFPPC